MLSILQDEYERCPIQDFPYSANVPYAILAVFIISWLWGSTTISKSLGFTEDRGVNTVRERHSSSQGSVRRYGKRSVPEPDDDIGKKSVLIL